MSLVKKAELWCDRCGASVEVDPRAPSVLLDPAAKGWLSVGDERHLCPACAKAYEEKKAALDEELQRFAFGG